MNPSSRLSLRLLGGFALERDARPCELAYEKGRALLAYLAAESARTHSRTFLAALFWPHLERKAALTNLRQILHDLRRSFDAPGSAAPPLRVGHGSVRLDAAGLEIDAAQLRAPVPACLELPSAERCEGCLAQMETVAGLYRGEFMAGFALPECPDFEAWLQVQREALHLRSLARLARLAECHERLGAVSRALTFALRFCELEPWSEDGLRRAMRLHALCGQRAAALELFDRAGRTLRRELDLAPAAETLALAEQIRSGDLLPPAPRLAPAAVPVPLTFAERRQVTVLHCKLDCPGVDDPDEALALLAAPQARCGEILRAQGGHLEQVRGASLLAYFGYPQAREDAARRALRAALALKDAQAPGVEVRVGAHTGLVLAGGESGVPDATGATTGLAIRLRQQAGAGEILISDTTRRLAAGYFEYVGLGVRRLSGAARDREIFRLLGESGAGDRLEADSRRFPLFGREDEIGILRAAWEDARRGARRHVLLRGEAGIGKSRLLLALKTALREREGVVRELRCHPEASQSPFQPLIGMVAAVLAFEPGDSPEARFARLAAYVETHYGAVDDDAVPLLAGLLGLPLRPPYRDPGYAPQQQRERLFALLVDRVLALAARHPVLLVVEDLHWADPSTCELIERFVADTRERGLLAVFAARPDFAPSWPRERVRVIELAPLSAAQTKRLAAGFAPALDTATLDRIAARADGIPLYAEELARAAVEGRDENVPATLHDLLAASLDALGEAKPVAQRAAAIGREFDLDLLRASLPFDAAPLARHLKQIEDAGLIERAASGAARFRHALIRDVAYESLARAERAAAHRAIAAALSARAPQLAEDLARHLAAAGEAPAAIAARLAAGQRAGRQAASREALAHFRAGLALLGQLPEGKVRDGLELQLQVGLGAAALAAEGYASAEGAAAYARAMALCAARAGGTEGFPAVWGLWASASSRVGYEGARELAAQLVELAEQSANPVHALQARFAEGDTAYWRGEFALALRRLDEVESAWRPEFHESQLAEYGEDAGVTGAAYRSWVLWMLGREREARAASDLSLARARELGHSFSLAYALTFAALLACRLDEPARALALADETLAIAGRHGFALWQIGAALARGWAQAQQGNDEGIDAIRRCVAAARAAMGGVTLVVLEPLAHACVLRGRHSEALAVIDEAFAVGAALGDRHIDAELWRLRGEALSGLAAPAADVAACSARARDIARAQGAAGLAARQSPAFLR